MSPHTLAMLSCHPQDNRCEIIPTDACVDPDGVENFTTPTTSMTSTVGWLVIWFVWLPFFLFCVPFCVCLFGLFVFISFCCLFLSACLFVWLVARISTVAPTRCPACYTRKHRTTVLTMPCTRVYAGRAQRPAPPARQRHPLRQPRRPKQPLPPPPCMYSVYMCTLVTPAHPSQPHYLHRRVCVRRVHIRTFAPISVPLLL